MPDVTYDYVIIGSGFGERIQSTGHRKRKMVSKRRFLQIELASAKMALVAIAALLRYYENDLFQTHRHIERNGRWRRITGICQHTSAAQSGFLPDRELASSG